MKTRLEKVYKKMPNQKVSLKSKKVALGLLDDVAQDEETIRIIRQNAEMIGIGADELFPNIDNYESELERLRVLSDQFESAVRMFSTY